jgi:hypothetical protein
MGKQTLQFSKAITGINLIGVATYKYYSNFQVDLMIYQDFSIFRDAIIITDDVSTSSQSVCMISGYQTAGTLKSHLRQTMGVRTTYMMVSYRSAHTVPTSTQQN